jgi:hypothetical protein
VYFIVGATIGRAGDTLRPAPSPTGSPTPAHPGPLPDQPDPKDRIHDEFVPSDAPDPHVQFSVAPTQITTELLELCEGFLRQASPIVHTELRQFLTENGYRPGGLGWFLDSLGFITLLNRTAPDNRPGAVSR